MRPFARRSLLFPPSLARHASTILPRAGASASARSARALKEAAIMAAGEGTQADAPLRAGDNEAALPIFKFHGNWGVPKTAGLRHLKMPYSPWLFPGRPFFPLTSPVRKKGGRDRLTGRLRVRGIGGGAKRRHRHIDYLRMEGGPQDVVRIEFDPNRSAHIALLRSRTGEGPHGGWSYIIAPDGLRAGDVVESFRSGVPKGLVPKWDDEIATKVAKEKLVLEQEEREKLKIENAKAQVDYLRAVRRGMVVAKGEVPLIPSIAAPSSLLSSSSSDDTTSNTPSSISAPPSPHPTASESIVQAENDESQWVDEDVSAAFATDSSSSFLPASYLSSPAPPALADFHIRDSPAYSTAHLSVLPPRPKPASILPLRVTGRLPGTVAYHDAGAGGSTPSFALNLLRSVIIKPGNVVAIGLVPLGQPIHNIALKQDGTMMLCRAGGCSGEVIGHQKVGLDGLKITHVKLQSGEIRRISSLAPCTIGQTSNKYHGQRNLGKAGRNRNLGRRPKVRGMAMNTIDHPHGGGRGKSKGNMDPRSPWGWLTRGVRTRKAGPNGHKHGNKEVIKERPRGKAIPAMVRMPGH
ncbi:hypothetical protein BDY24DRAFT_389908 [Mrakia frigida]|uniref:mitochondrial 54S ribosomal protein uL2m RML2 n=1 Tax=Mrakia frigida TaxID=29902 RepID=UPI003FCC0FD8